MQPLEVTLPGAASSVPPARRFVEHALEVWELDGVTWTATLLVSELAANAALHAGTDFTVRVALTGERVRLEVEDGSPALPRQRQHSAEATTGRGLRLVDELAAAWGVETGPGGGKVVWVELPTSSSGLGVDEDDTELDVDALLDGFSDELDVPGQPGDLRRPGRALVARAA